MWRGARLDDARHEDGDEDVELERVGADDGGHDGELGGEGEYLVLGEVQSDGSCPCRDTVQDQYDDDDVDDKDDIDDDDDDNDNIDDDDIVDDDDDIDDDDDHDDDIDDDVDDVDDNDDIDDDADDKDDDSLQQTRT